MGKIKWYATAKLKELREERNYSQREMADLLEMELGRPISESLYQQWETGVQNMLPEQVLEIARWARLPYRELVVEKQ